MTGRFAAYPLTPALGARIDGVDLAADMSDDTFAALCGRGDAESADRI